jgi:hypothetical protein
MKTANERLDFLKWVSANFKKINRLQETIDKLADEVTRYPTLQDINVHSATKSICHLADRLLFIENEIDSAHFVNTGELKEKAP